MASKYVVFYVFSLFLLLHELHSSFAQTWVKAGYWFPASEFPISDINSSLFTHLNCAFADVNPNTYQLNISSSDEPFFNTFTKTVQQKNPSILTLLSISANSSIYSSMVSQSSSRKAFIDSSIKTARLYGFNGLDLCWVSPSTGSDMINMGTLFDEWRTAVDTELRNSSVSKLILTAAVRYSPVLDSAIFPVESIGRNLDWVHVMAYDYHKPSLANLTGAHAALYDPSSLVSTDYGRGEWIGRGLTAKKLVLALPYYGYAWTLVKPENHGIAAPATGQAISKDGSMRYINIKDFIRSSGAPSVYNSTMVMNYCYNGSTWIGFDDVEAIATKVEYAKEKGLLGYVVWHVANDDNWVLTQAAQAVQVNNKDRGNKGRLLVIILVPIITLAMLLLGFLIWYLRKRRVEHKGKKETSPMLREEENDDLELPLFSFSYVTTATNNFSDENKLGEGGFGPVYKGKLLNGQEIAVKRLSRSSGQGLKEFKNEITLIAKLQHVNLVRVLGCCIERDEKILIYEYMPNKSLDFYLFDPIKRVLLDSKKRVQIIEGVAQGLLYLHKYSRLKVIHRDLKASNILLDNEMNPKISDFGMARIFRRNENQANTNRVVGTFGYMPPEYVRQGIFSIKSDVFSFGVLVLEIISDKKNTGAYGLDESLNLLGYAWMLWSEGKSMEFLDPILLNNASSDFKLMKCIHVALLCVQERAVDRPTMSDVISMLSNETMNLPTPKQPAFSTRQSTNEEGFSTRNDVTMSEIVAQ